MVSDNLIAACLGGFSSAIKFRDQGLFHVLQIVISSTCLGFFAGPDIAKFFLEYTGVVISYVTACFILSYCGSTILDRLVLFIKAFQVSRKWNS